MQQEPARNWRLLLGLSGMVVGLVLHTVGQGQPYWASFTPENSSKSVYTGLWEVCGELGCYRTAIDSISFTQNGILQEDRSCVVGCGYSAGRGVVVAASKIKVWC